MILKVYAVATVSMTSIIFKVVCFGGAAWNSPNFTQFSSIIAKAEKVAARSIFSNSAGVGYSLSVERLSY